MVILSVVLVTAFVASLDMVVLRVARGQLSKLNNDEQHLELAGVHVSLLTQSLSLYGLDVEKGKAGEIGYTDMQVARVRANHVNVLRALRDKHLELHDVRIDGLDIDAIAPHPEGQVQLRGNGIDVDLRAIGYQDTIQVDSISVTMDSMAVHLKKWHAPDHPYGMPQEGLAKLPMPLSIGRLVVDVDMFDFALTTQEVSYASIRSTNVHALSRHIENAPGSRITLNTEARLPRGGHAWIGFTMVQNKACDMLYDVLIVKAQGADLDNMLRPLVGVTMDCTIDTLATKLKGNSNVIDGDFLLRYHDLAVTVHKGESPYQIVNKNAGAINSFANSLLPKSNPSLLTPDNVRRYRVHANRDLMKPFVMMPIMAMVDGMKDTLLPGLFVHKKIITQPKAPKALPSRHSHESAQ